MAQLQAFSDTKDEIGALVAELLVRKAFLAILSPSDKHDNCLGDKTLIFREAEIVEKVLSMLYE